MKNDLPPSAHPHVLHLVGRLTDTAFRFLAPATLSLASAGYRQTLILLDDPRYSHRIAELHESIDVVAVPLLSARWQRWAAFAARVHQVCGQSSVSAVHLHGVLPWVLGARLGLSLPHEASLYVSPHGSRLLRLLHPLRWLTRPLIPLLKPKRRTAFIAACTSDTQQLQDSGIEALSIEPPIGQVYFNLMRNEARRPLVVSGAARHDRRSIETFCRLSVLLSASELGLSFNWMGRADEAASARLKAANVGLFQTDKDDDLAARLAPGWVYLAAGGRTGFPLMLARAMAAGLPCLAADLPHHRELIRDGENGLLYRSDDHALTLLTHLLEDSPLRARLGQAARQDALKRFSTRSFGRALLAAYQLQQEYDVPLTAAPNTRS